MSFKEEEIKKIESKLMSSLPKGSVPRQVVRKLAVEFIEEKIKYNLIRDKMAQSLLRREERMMEEIYKEVKGNAHG